MDANKLIKILPYGLHGPVRGKVYADVMPAMRWNDDTYIASVLSYIRTDFGNKAHVIYPAYIIMVRQETVGRADSWRMDELNAKKTKFT